MVFITCTLRSACGFCHKMEPLTSHRHLTEGKGQIKLSALIGTDRLLYLKGFSVLGAICLQAELMTSDSSNDVT